MNPIWIVVIILGALLLVSPWVFFLPRLRKLAMLKRDGVVAKLGEHNILVIEPGANCFGERSRGAKQVRGNGCWALTREKIYFEYWVGTHAIDIPLREVCGTRIAKSFLGKTRGRTLLVVAYRNEQGEEDECAWLFQDPESVRGRIEELIAGNQS